MTSLSSSALERAVLIFEEHDAPGHGLAAEENGHGGGVVVAGSSAAGPVP